MKVDCSDNMVLFSGRYVHPNRMTEDDVDILDIAQGLSNMCRFSGQCTSFYSVAQHSVHCAQVVGQYTGDVELARIALLHDAPEAYLSDLVRCVKGCLPGYRLMEDYLWGIVCKKFKLMDGPGYPPGLDLPPEVKSADYRMLVTERLHLISEKSSVWDLQKTHEPYPMAIIPWPPEQAREAFLKQYNRLFS